MKNESPFKLDMNEAFSQICDIVFGANEKSQQSSIIINQRDNLLNSEQSMVEFKAVVDTIKDETLKAAANNRTYLDILMGSGSTTLGLVCVGFAAAFLFAYKYFKLRKKTSLLLSISKKNLAITENCLSLISLYKKIILKNKELTINLIANLENRKEQLLKLYEVQNNKYLKEKLEKYQRNFCKILLNASDAKFTEITQKLKKSSITFIKTKMGTLYNEKFYKRSFSQQKMKPAYMVAAGINLVVFYSLIDYGLTDLYREEFVANILQQSFPYSEYDIGLCVADFSRPDADLNFKIVNHNEVVRRGIDASKSKALILFDY
jgi:hypothetical protein